MSRGNFAERGGKSVVAKGKYQRWLEPDGLTLLEGWARDGLTDEQLAREDGYKPSNFVRLEEQIP